MQVQSTLFFETAEQIYERVFRDLKPRTPVPEIEVRFRPSAGANSGIRLRDGKLLVKIADILEGAPAPIHEALAYILVGKLYRRPIPPIYGDRYHRFLNRADLRRKLHLLRQTRGRKHISGGQGDHYDLDSMFEDLNFRFFNGLMARPLLGWSRQRSRTTLGHFDPSHNAIILSRILDRGDVPRIAVEYVLYHEMLHLRFPTQHRGARRCVHTPEFKAAEKEFPGLNEAKQALKQLG